MIKSVIDRILGRDMIFIVSCVHENAYAESYYAVETKNKNNAIRMVIDFDPTSKNHIIKSVIGEDIIISNDEMYYVDMWLRFTKKHILIMAPGNLVKSVVKYKYPHEDGIYTYKIVKMLPVGYGQNYQTGPDVKRGNCMSGEV